MKNKNKVLLIIFLVSLIIIPFSFTNAQAPIVPCGSGSDLSNSCTLCHLIVGIHRLITFGRNILISVAAVGIFISGVMYVVSSGNESAMTKAKGFLSASLVGFSIVLAAWLIVNVTMWALSFKTDIIEKENWYTFTCSTRNSTSSPTPALPPASSPASWYFQTYDSNITHGPYLTEGECQTEHVKHESSASKIDPCYNSSTGSSHSTTSPASWYFQTYDSNITHGPYLTEGECQAEHFRVKYESSASKIDPCYDSSTGSSH